MLPRKRRLQSLLKQVSYGSYLYSSGQFFEYLFHICEDISLRDGYINLSAHTHHHLRILLMETIPRSSTKATKGKSTIALFTNEWISFNASLVTVLLVTLFLCVRQDVSKFGDNECYEGSQWELASKVLDCSNNQ